MAMLTVSQVTVPLLFTKELSLKPSQAPASSADCLQFWPRRSSRPWWPNPPVLSCPDLNLKTVKIVSHTHPKDLINKSYYQNISLTKGHGSRCLESDEKWSYGFLGRFAPVDPCPGGLTRWKFPSVTSLQSSRSIRMIGRNCMPRPSALSAKCVPWQHSIESQWGFHVFPHQHIFPDHQEVWGAIRTLFLASCTEVMTSSKTVG